MENQTTPQVTKSVSVVQKSDPRNSGYVPGSMAERIAMVWPLTREVVSLGKKYDAEQPLQRHIVGKKS
jgi:hypothetical protein